MTLFGRRGAGAAPAKPALPKTAVTSSGVTVEVRRSAAARRLSLRVSRLDGSARLTAPSRCAEREIRAFLAHHAEWLAAAVGRAPQPLLLVQGAQALFRGQRFRLEAAPGRRGVAVDWEAMRIRVGGGETEIGPRFGVWLREEARARLLERSQAHAATLGVGFAKIAIRDTRSRWGSCSSSGALSYSWRLVMAPDSVLDYVAAHEVAHLCEMNHSARFWAVVERLRPDWRVQRAWLRAHGGELHRFALGPSRGAATLAHEAAA